MYFKTIAFVFLSVYKWEKKNPGFIPSKRNDTDLPSIKKKFHVVKLIAWMRNPNDFVHLEKSVSTFWQL
jgi:hypothetical protein